MSCSACPALRSAESWYPGGAGAVSVGPSPPLPAGWVLANPPHRARTSAGHHCARDQQKWWAHALQGCARSRRLKVHGIPYGSKIIQGEIMQIVNMFKLKRIMLKTSAQVAVNLFYSQRTQLRLFSPVRGPGGSGAGETWRCSNKLPEAPAHASVCDNTWKLAGKKSSIVITIVHVALHFIH